jgi:hypothetical protein
LFDSSPTARGGSFWTIHSASSERRARGHWVGGRPPLGYRRAAHEPGGEIRLLEPLRWKAKGESVVPLVAPSEACVIVEEIFAPYVRQALGVHAIAGRLNRRRRQWARRMHGAERRRSSHASRPSTARSADSSMCGRVDRMSDRAYAAHWSPWSVNGARSRLNSRPGVLDAARARPTIPGTFVDELIASLGDSHRVLAAGEPEARKAVVRPFLAAIRLDAAAGRAVLRW